MESTILNKMADLGGVFVLSIILIYQIIGRLDKIEALLLKMLGLIVLLFENNKKEKEAVNIISKELKVKEDNKA